MKIQDMIIESLEDGPWCCWEIAVAKKINKHAVSKELTIMARSGLVRRTTERMKDPATSMKNYRYLLSKNGWVALHLHLENLRKGVR